jgi:hypothetical protein
VVPPEALLVVLREVRPVYHRHVVLPEEAHRDHLEALPEQAHHDHLEALLELALLELLLPVRQVGHVPACLLVQYPVASECPEWVKRDPN